MKILLKLFPACVVFAMLAIVIVPVKAHADHLLLFDFALEVAQTNPPAVFPDGATLPSGSALVTIDTIASTIAWDVDYQDLTGPIIAPGAHFHGPAEMGTNAGVQIFLTNGDPAEPATGNLAGSAAITSDQIQQVVDGLWYLNIHTAANGSGELRGQVIPEPGSLALATGGLLAIFAGLRKRRS